MTDIPKYFVPVDSASVAHYLGSALITPSAFFPSKPKDIQNVFPENILISSEKWVGSCNCSIEVILTPEEILLASKYKSFILLDKPIPLSRVVKIHFINDSQMKVSIWNINQGAAFVPQHLFVVEVTKPNYIPAPNPSDFVRKEKTLPELEERIKRYDIVLGGLAFMRIGTLSSDGYPKNYFSTLSSFNASIEQELIEASKTNGLAFSKKYGGLFSRGESEWTKWLKYIYNDIPSKEIESIAFSQGVKISSKYGLLQLDELDHDSIIFDLALLATYGNNKPKSLDDLLSYLHRSKLPEGKIEQIALLVGLRHGYTRLRNEYQLGEKHFAVKFELNSKLDYYTIESIYQTVFNINRKNSTFPYLSPVVSRFDNAQKDRNADFEILGTPVYIRGKEDEKTRDKTISAKPLINTLIRKIVNEQQRINHPFMTLDVTRAASYFGQILEKDILSYITEIQREAQDYGRSEAERKYLKQIANQQQKIEELETSLKNRLAESKAEKNIKIEQNIQNQIPSLFDDQDGNKDLQGKQIADLKKIAQKEGIPGLSKLKKGEEAKAIEKIVMHRKKIRNA
ncbi:hypothetical protein [Fluviicola sp.]|uniref:hypothetical protein n=1 Tax=Fluviicola sp. TaxID=1917219 RepID=UPI0031CE628C